MLGLMQDQPLLISSLIEFVERHNGDGEIVSRRSKATSTAAHGATSHRAPGRWPMRWTASSLLFSDRIATLAWNGYRHLELYYGASGSGRVLHTINPRLHPDQIAWIANHAEDQILCFDLTLPAAGAGRACALSHDPEMGCTVRCGQAPCRQRRAQPRELRSLDGRAVHRLRAGPASTRTPPRACATRAAPPATRRLRSTATARPCCMPTPRRCPTSWRLSARDSVLPVVPMFHVNAWGIPYSAALAGCKLVFPGPALDGKSVFELIEAEGVTFAAGVPDRLADAAGPHAGERAEVLASSSAPSSAARPARRP